MFPPVLFLFYLCFTLEVNLHLVHLGWCAPRFEKHKTILVSAMSMQTLSKNNQFY